MPPVFRFAPSPNGLLHLGHAYSALLNAVLAREMGGRFLVRIEDIDTTRCTPEFTARCFEDLAWLGLRWEEPVRIQSQHFREYAKALDRLRERSLLYPCFCSRQEIARLSEARDPDDAPRYAGTCQRLDAGEQAARIANGMPHSWRLRVDEALADVGAPLVCDMFDPVSKQCERHLLEVTCWGDVILARKEIPTSYHLSVVVDDAVQDITHVVRGADLEAATAVHVLLQRLLDLPTPHYHHHALLRDAQGDKLSKSAGHRSIASWRNDGVTASELRRRLGFS